MSDYIICRNCLTTETQGHRDSCVDSVMVSVNVDQLLAELRSQCIRNESAIEGLTVMRYVNWWYENIVVITFESNKFVALKMTADHDDSDISISAVGLDDIPFGALEKAELINLVQMAALHAAAEDGQAKARERTERQKLRQLLRKYPPPTYG